MAGVIPERAGRILNEPPRNGIFDWVDHVSVALTTQMRATLFDYPFETLRMEDVCVSPLTRLASLADLFRAK
jgi:hypothetical protein